MLSIKKISHLFGFLAILVLGLGILLGTPSSVFAGSDAYEKIINEAIEDLKQNYKEEDALKHEWVKGVRTFVETSIALGNQKLETIVTGSLKDLLANAKNVSMVNKVKEELKKMALEFQENHKTLKEILTENFEGKDVLKSKIVKDHLTVSKKIGILMRCLSTFTKWAKNYEAIEAKIRSWMISYGMREVALKMLKRSFDKKTEEAIISELNFTREIISRRKEEIRATLIPQKNADYKTIVGVLQQRNSEANGAAFSTLSNFLTKYIEDMNKDLERFEKTKEIKNYLEWPDGPLGKLVKEIENKMSKNYKKMARDRHEIEKWIKSRNYPGLLSKINKQMTRFNSTFDKLIKKKIDFQIKRENIDFIVKLADIDLQWFDNQKKLLDNYLSRALEGCPTPHPSKDEVLQKIHQFVKEYGGDGSRYKKEVEYVKEEKNRYIEDFKKLNKIKQEMIDIKHSRLEANPRSLLHFDKKKEIVLEITNLLLPFGKKLGTAVKYLDYAGKALKAIPEPHSKLAGTLLSAPNKIKSGVLDLQLAKLAKIEGEINSKGTPYGIQMTCLQDFKTFSLLTQRALEIFKIINLTDIKIVEHVVDHIIKDVADNISVMKDKGFQDSLANGDMDKANRIYDVKVPSLASKIQFRTFEEFEQDLKIDYLKQLDDASDYYGVLEKKIGILQRISNRLNGLGKSFQVGNILILEATIDGIRKRKAEMAMGNQKIQGELRNLKNALSRRK